MASSDAPTSGSVSVIVKLTEGIWWMSLTSHVLSGGVKTAMIHRIKMKLVTQVFQPHGSMPSQTYPNAVHGIEGEMTTRCVIGMAAGTQGCQPTIALPAARILPFQLLRNSHDETWIERLRHSRAII